MKPRHNPGNKYVQYCLQKNSVVLLSFDLITGPFLPGLMPRLGLRGASR
jgi:hypothetical protein